MLLSQKQWFLKNLSNLREESKLWAFTTSLQSKVTSMWTLLKSIAVYRSLSKISTTRIPEEAMLQEWAIKSSAKILRNSRCNLVTTKSSLKLNNSFNSNKKYNNNSSKSKCSSRITMHSFYSKVLYHRSALCSGTRRFHTEICLAQLDPITTYRTATTRRRWTTTWCPTRTKVSIGRLTIKFAIHLGMSLATPQARMSIPS